MSREDFSLATPGMVVEKPIVFRLTKKNAKPALQGRYYPSIKRLPSEEIIYDPSKRANRTIRYAPSEQSIYKDEQPDKVLLGDIVFQNGTLIVQYTNPLLLEYMAKSNFNQDNPARIRGSRIIFMVLDPEGDAKKSMEAEVVQVRAANAALNMEFSDLKGYARVLGVNTNNAGDIIRHDMLVLAKKSPEMFMSGIDDPMTKRQQVILDAKDFSIIEITNRGVSWIMGDKKSLIVPVPIGQSALTYFAEWTIQEKEGEKVYAEIEKKIKKLSD